LSEGLYRLEVASLDLGPDAPSVGLELIDPETREPITGSEAARIWAATLSSLAGEEPWAVDYFAHLERVRDFCRSRGIAFREPNPRVLVVAQPPAGNLPELCERFAGETFGVRTGGAAVAGDPAVEGGLAGHGVDAYHAAFPQYLFCAVCDFENGFLTLLGNRLWASEVIRRVRAALTSLQVEVALRSRGLAAIGAYALTPCSRAANCLT
jgi:hypothetical protein